MGHPGGVQDAATGAFWRTQIGIAVEVGQPDVVVDALKPRHDTQTDRAVTTKHHRHLTGAGMVFNSVCHAERDPDHRVDVARRRIEAIRRPPLARHVAGVEHAHPHSAKPLDETVLAQRRRRQVLTSVVCTGTGGDTHHDEINCDRHMDIVRR